VKSTAKAKAEFSRELEELPQLESQKQNLISREFTRKNANF